MSPGTIDADVVVHGYLEVDVDLLHRLLNQHLGEFETFSRRVDDFVTGC